MTFRLPKRPIANPGPQGQPRLIPPSQAELLVALTPASQPLCDYPARLSDKLSTGKQAATAAEPLCRAQEKRTMPESKVPIGNSA